MANSNPQNQAPDIDLSAGLEPAPTTSTAGASAPSEIDLSAGLEPAAPSAAQPAQPTPDQQPILSRAWNAVKSEAAPIVDAAKSVVTPPQDHKEQIVHAIGGFPALQTYRAARNVVEGLENTIKAPTEKYNQAKSDLQRGIQDMQNGDYRNVASDIASGISDVAPAVLPTVPNMDRTREISEGARKGGDLVTPLVKTGVDLGTAALLDKVGGASEGEAPAPKVSASKIEPAVAARTAKAGLPAGEAGLTPEAAKAATTQSAVEAQKATQTNIDQTLQDIAARHATENNLPSPAKGTASRDILTNNGQALVDAGKANYKILDKYTDGRFTNVQQELKNAQLELQQKAGVTGVDTSDLEANVTRAQMKVDNLFDEAVKNGMPEDTAEAARTQFRTGQATLDAGNAVRMANRARGAAGVRTTDLNALENRWTALHDTGRLQQAFGEQGAKDALTQVHAAREAGEVFESMPPTESQALRQLIAKHTESGKFGTTTDWGAIRKEFSAMPNKTASFSDVPKVEKFINDQKFYQSVYKWGGRAIAGAAGTAAAGLSYEAGRDLLK